MSLKSENRPVVFHLVAVAPSGEETKLLEREFIHFCQICLFCENMGPNSGFVLYFFRYMTEFCLPKQSQKSRSIL